MAKKKPDQLRHLVTLRKTLKQKNLMERCVSDILKNSLLSTRNRSLLFLHQIIIDSKKGKTVLKTQFLALTALTVAVSVYAENVEIYLVDMLDNIQDGYCLDIAKGRGDAANPDDGLQAHTCYSPSGEVLVDQAFDPNQFANGVLYMPEFDVCMQATDASMGGAIELADCNQSQAQRWVFNGEGTITPALASNICLTASGETTTGRSSENQMIALSFEMCSESLSATQTWSNRTAQ